MLALQPSKNLGSIQNRNENWPGKHFQIEILHYSQWDKILMAVTIPHESAHLTSSGFFKKKPTST